MWSKGNPFASCGLRGTLPWGSQGLAMSSSRTWINPLITKHFTTRSRRLETFCPARWDVVVCSGSFRMGTWSEIGVWVVKGTLLWFCSLHLTRIFWKKPINQLSVSQGAAGYCSNRVSPPQTSNLNSTTLLWTRLSFGIVFPCSGHTLYPSVLQGHTKFTQSNSSNEWCLQKSNLAVTTESLKGRLTKSSEIAEIAFLVMNVTHSWCLPGAAPWQ